MDRRYYKRYRMEIGLRQLPFAPPPPPGYDYIGWSPHLLEGHAEVKWRSFADELDAIVFPCLADYDGCLRLMHDIAASEDFVPEATWLAVHYHESGPRFCGTIQGIRGRLGVGNVQNVGTLLEHRGQGIGRGLLLRALSGFRSAGLRTASLEVTSENVRALTLYRRIGFRHARTVYKSVESADRHETIR